MYVLLSCVCVCVFQKGNENAIVSFKMQFIDVGLGLVCGWESILFVAGGVAVIGMKSLLGTAGMCVTRTITST